MHGAYLCCLGVFLQGDPPAEIELVPVDGAPVKIAKFSFHETKIKGVGHLGRGEVGEWALRDLMTVRFPSQQPARLSGIHVRLAEDEVVRCSSIEAAGADEFEVRGNLFGNFKIPAESIVGAVLDPDADERQSERAAGWMKQPKDSDALLFRNFDEAKGSFVGLDENAVTLEVDGSKRKTPRGQALALAFDSRLLQPKTANETYAFVRLADGTRIRASRMTMSEDRPETAVLHTLLGGAMTVKRAHIVDLSVRNGRVVYLSDLAEQESSITPYLDDAWPVQKDRAVNGEPIRLARQVYSKGLGMRSGTTATFEVQGFSRFEATIGLDDSAGPLGHAVFSVSVDGKRATEEIALQGGDPPRAVSVPLANAKRMKLAVDFGQRGDVQDFADWADARLVK